jgi:hypothetical protein
MIAPDWHLWPNTHRGEAEMMLRLATLNRIENTIAKLARETRVKANTIAA